MGRHRDGFFRYPNGAASLHFQRVEGISLDSVLLPSRHPLCFLISLSFHPLLNPKEVPVALSLLSLHLSVPLVLLIFFSLLPSPQAIRFPRTSSTIHSSRSSFTFSCWSSSSSDASLRLLVAFTPRVSIFGFIALFVGAADPAPAHRHCSYTSRNRRSPAALPLARSVFIPTVQQRQRVPLVARA